MDPQPVSMLGNLSTLLRKMADDPAGAADDIEAMGCRLIALARQLREQGGGPLSTGGMTDRVQINVVGPDGQLKKSVDTDRRL